MTTEQIKTLRCENSLDGEGRPSGGFVSLETPYGTMFWVNWQRGPLGRGDDRQEPNGAFVETVIFAAYQRIAFYNASGFECDENHAALSYLAAALQVLDQRTQRREAEGVEGTHGADGGAATWTYDPTSLLEMLGVEGLPVPGVSAPAVNDGRGQTPEQIAARAPRRTSGAE